MGRIAIVAGSTGLVGSQLIDLLLNDTQYDRVVAISRKPLEIQHNKLKNLVMELEQINQSGLELKGDDVFCCLGTTMRKAKTKEAFLKVDVEAPISLAQVTRQQGAQQFLLVSALGANSSSSIFYNRAKGQVEQEIQKVGFPTLYFLRPSLLLGPRKEQRSGEDAAKLFYRIFGFLIPKSYQAIESIKVARAMMTSASKGQSGNYILESSQLQSFSA